MKYCLLFFSAFTIFQLNAQIDREQQPANDAATLRVNSNRLYGKLLDKNTGKPIEAASVQLFAAGPSNKDSLVAGMLTKANGGFQFRSPPSPEKFPAAGVCHRLCRLGADHYPGIWKRK